jgi:putative tryptophan/tyrosine transport system substrate-binding protein
MLLGGGQMPIDIARRQFISALGSVAVAWPLGARAQQPAMPVIGFLHGGVADGFTREMEGFRLGLKETGNDENRNVAIEFRWAEGHYDRLPGLVADLIRRNVAVIVASPTPPALAAKAATATIPIVFELGTDPVAAGLVTSLNRPGGNITGISNLSVALVSKRLEVMHQIVPDAMLFAVLLNPSNLATFQTETAFAREAAATLGIRVQFLEAGTSQEIEAAFAKAAELRAGALVIGADPFFVSMQNETAALAARYGLPTIDIQRGFVTAGGLISYGGDFVDAYRLAGVYTGRILKGEKPADLPVQQSTKIEMVVNLKAAKALGITIPLAVLGRADEVIE